MHSVYGVARSRVGTRENHFARQHFATVTSRSHRAVSSAAEQPNCCLVMLFTVAALVLANKRSRRNQVSKGTFGQRC
jgi:uncharacterized MAPEG superfamily protein